MSQETDTKPGIDATPIDTESEVAVLRTENQRLRREYLRARQSQYRKSALALGVVGLIAFGAAALLPTLKSVFIILGSIGIFTGTLLYFLTPDRLVPMSVGESSYHAHHSTGIHIREELGLADEAVYVSPDEDTNADTRLFIPQQTEYDIPDYEALGEFFVNADTPQTRGVSFTPTGQRLFDELSTGVVGTDVTPEDRFETLGDALVEQFELVDSVDLELNTDDGRATARIENPAYGSTDQFDHPAVSLLCVGLAESLDTPVRVDGHLESDNGTLVTLRF
ncbi:MULTISPECIES: MerC domain-containing protein [Haloferax]|uniref:DUF7982 domain-containing protein n=1 Tax=Haloferax marinum TaxID=2666143 RepID=A0A6A8G848_9EURY|nr:MULTISPECIES: MerC domain-containing protein [Haloferax]KAB1198229.1 hypothetical protein Hfx1150_12185 [Haloferax sp. CBA1150]MRW97319.1 hypothetical protein [Haloferax marinum]